MNVVAFNGSARKDSNTIILVKKVFKELKKASIETEIVQLTGKKSGVALPAENVMKTVTSGASLKTILPMNASKRCWNLTESSWHRPRTSRMFQRR